MTAPATAVDEATEAVIASEVERWGHPVDAVDRAAIRLAVADRHLSAVAGISEELEDAAYHIQSGAFNDWWSECQGSSAIAAPGDWAYAAWVRDVSYGAAVGAIKHYIGSTLRVASPR